MNEHINLDLIEPGMVVYGADGGEIGPVEAVHPVSISVASQEVPREAIAHVDTDGVYLQVAKFALMARHDPGLEGAPGAADPAANPERDRAVAADYDRARLHFEEHFRRTRPQDAPAPPGDFRDAEPNYRAGFAAGRDPRYDARAFDDVADELHPARADAGTNPADDAAWLALRQQLREGFEHARRGRQS